MIHRLFFGLFVCAFLFDFFYFEIRGWSVSVCSTLGFRCEIMERYEGGAGSCKRSFIPVLKQGARLKMILFTAETYNYRSHRLPLQFAPKQDSFIFFTAHSGPQHIQQTRERPRPRTSAAKNKVSASIQ